MRARSARLHSPLVSSNDTLAGARVKSERCRGQDETDKTSDHGRTGRKEADDCASNGTGASDRHRAAQRDVPEEEPAHQRRAECSDHSAEAAAEH